MLAYSLPVDIANRALQHCRMARITSLFPPDSNMNAQEIAFCYDKVRTAELERNCWTFSTREVILRPLDTTTLQWTPTTYSATTTYAVGYVVNYNGDYYQAQPGVAVGDIPDIAATWLRYFGPITYDPFITTNQPYYAGEIVSNGGVIYLSLISNNMDTPPTANWLVIGGTGAALSILYPIGSGPGFDPTTRNVFRRPYGFLRQAPSDPKKLDRYVGGPDYYGADDWLWQGQYITSGQFEPLYLRFVADIIDVTSMSPMFCEGLAARIAKEVGPTLQPDKALLNALLTRVDQAYKLIMGEARTADGILAGTVDPEEDEYIMCRL